MYDLIEWLKKIDEKSNDPRWSKCVNIGKANEWMKYFWLFYFIYHLCDSYPYILNVVIHEIWICYLLLKK